MGTTLEAVLPARVQIACRVLDELSGAGTGIERGPAAAVVLGTMHAVAVALDDVAAALDPADEEGPAPTTENACRAAAYTEVAAWLDPLDPLDED